MTIPERRQEIDRIFLAAIKRKPADRSGFLDQACAGDAQLRREVEALLATDVTGSLAGPNAVQEPTRLLAKQKESEAKIGRYKIIRSLGSGGMGHVYLGLDEQLNRHVAVKLLSNYGASEDERMFRFRQEALAASALNHPNILTIHEIGESEGRNFITAEFVDGQTLRAIMKEGALLQDQALEIAIQIGSALSAAHNSGIIHRDIKPENVMVRKDGLVKVLDFGIAKFNQLDGDEKHDLVKTAPGTVVGTSSYMSPEQARGLPVDARTDIWSLGVILYEVLGGVLPFTGDTSADVISKVLGQQPTSLTVTRPEVSPTLEQIVFKALEKDRESRYQTPTDLIKDLKSEKHRLALIAEEQSSHNKKVSQAAQPESAAGGPTTSSLEYTIGGIKKHKVAAITLLLLLVVVSTAAFLYYRSGSQKQIQSIAVMPFVNASGNTDVEYVSDGLTESLITSLSQLPELFVKARGSVFRYKGKDVSPQQLGKELNVQAILNGRVVQRGNDLSFHIELVDVETETALWSGDYSRSMTNLVTLQSEIGRDVSQKLRSKLSGAEVQRVTKDYTANAEAYQLYLKGRFLVFKLTPPDVLQAISYFQQAIQLDPNYALAYVGLSEANRTLVLGAEVGSPEFLTRAKGAAETAVKLDDSLAEAHTALGASMFWHDWNWIEVENQYKRGLELNPNSVDALMFYAHLCSVLGRHDEAIAKINRARELDPYAPFLNTLSGQFLENAGRFDEALIRLRETYDLAPGFWFPHLFASAAYMNKGMFAEALIEARHAKELSRAQTISTAHEAYALAKLNRTDEARALLDELLKLSKEKFVSPYHLAMVYNGLGDKEQSLNQLERGFELRDPKMVFLKVDHSLDNLRGDPRFVRLMQRMGFAE